jgi:hypothetical protein
VAKLKRMKNILVLKTGEALVGRVLDKEFAVKSAFGDLKFKPKQIVHIHFAGPPGFPVDELQIISGDRIKGDVSPQRLRFELESTGQEIQVPKAQIHTAVFLDTVSG